jgi:chromosome segregation ATPase
LKNDIAVLNESLIEREQEKLSLLSELRELQATIDDLTSGLQQADTQYKNQMETNVLQQEELVSRNNELTSTVDKLSTSLHDVEAKSRRDLLSHEVTRRQLMSDIRDLQNLVSATKIKLETINSDHVRVVTEKESELESMAFAIVSNEQEISRLTIEVASLKQVLIQLESEGTSTMDAVDTARKMFERERESLNDCIQKLRLELSESINAVKKEESQLESLRDKLSVSNQIEQDLCEKVGNITKLFSTSQDEIKRLSDELDTVMECHKNSLSEIGEKHRSSIETISHSHVDELHVYKSNVDQLRQRLQEETDLCSSLRDLVKVKEQVMHDQSTEINLLNTKIVSIEQRMLDAESQFTREQQQLYSTIDEQKLVVEQYTQSEMRLGLMLKAMRFDYDQVVVDFSDTREAITMSIESLKHDYDEVVRRVVTAFKADKLAARREIESVSNKLSQAMKHYQEALALKDEEIQRQHGLLQELQLRWNEATNDFEIATYEWEQEKTSYEGRLQTLQDEVDENECLKSEIECAELAYSDKLSTIESDWKTFQLALHQLAACIAHEDHELPIEAIPDTTTLLQTFVELFQQKLDQISTLKLQLTAQSQDDQAACDLLSKLNETKQLMDGMSHKLSSERSYRQLAEMKCIAAETALADDKVRISVLEHQSKEMEEDALLQAKEIKSLTAHIEEVQSKIDEMNTNDQLLSREVKDLELRLEQAEGQKKRLELKYERSLAEIESCQKHSNDLMTIIIEKNKDVQSKEGKVLDLQYQVDDLQSKIDGWVCAFNGLSSTAAEQLDFSSPDDVVANIVATNALYQDKQTADIAKLEEQCLQLKEEMRQQALMHQAIVSGLEHECQSLSDECFDVNAKLKDKNDYVITLEDVKCQLMAKLDTLTKDKENLHRRLCDLQTTCNILRQQKLDAKSLSNDSKSVISAVKMLAGIATVHSSKLEGFSCTDMSLSTWSEDVDFIARFIEYMSIINQKNSIKIERVKDSIRSPKTLVIRGDDGGHDVAENSSTPKAKGRNVASTELVVVPAQHSDILEDLLCVKNSITSIMSSPKLSTSKKVRQGEKKDAVCDDDLYTDLLNAHDQLKSLSGKIEAMTDDQRYYESRILELEEENEKIMMMARGSPLDGAAISSSDERMKYGALLLSNMQQRHDRLLLQNAFKTWNSKVRMCKQVSIAKDMAKELIKTRKTVLLLKSQMEIE